MTAQFGDLFRYQEKEYTVVALSTRHLFKPQEFGLQPHSRSTACYRGYWCEYAIDDECLVLKDLFLFNRDGNYPPLNGVEIAPQEFEKLECSEPKGREPIMRPAHFGHRVYCNVDLLLPYTGKILLGKDFMREYYIHMGFQRAWGYRRLIELEFDEGLLLESKDLSYMAREKREELSRRSDDPRHQDKKSIPRFIEESFSLDYAEKVWWPEG